MPTPTTVEQLRGLVPGADDLRIATNWPEWLIEDYLNLFDSLVFLAETSDTDIDLLADIQQDIESLRVKINRTYARTTNNAKEITENDHEVESLRVRERKNAATITVNSKNIAENDQEIQSTRSFISRNKARIQENLNGLKSLKQSLISLAATVSKVFAFVKAVKRSLINYLYLPGRVGGQVAHGGFGSGATNYLLLHSNTSFDDRVYFGSSGTCYHEGLDSFGIRNALPGAGLSPAGDTLLHLDGDGASNAGRTTLFIENTTASSAAMFVCQNNSGNYFAGLMGGSGYALANEAFFFTAGAGTLPIVFATDGTTPTGGPSSIAFQPGGFQAANKSVWFTPDKRVSINSTVTPAAQLDLTTTVTTNIGQKINLIAAATADAFQVLDSTSLELFSISVNGDVGGKNRTKQFFYAGM